MYITRKYLTTARNYRLDKWSDGTRQNIGYADSTQFK